MAVIEDLSNGRHPDIPCSAGLEPVPEQPPAALEWSRSCWPEVIFHFASRTEARPRAACPACDARRKIPPHAGTGKATSLARGVHLARSPFPFGRAIPKKQAIPGEQVRSVLDCSKAKQVLNWAPATILGEGFSPTVRWFAEPQRARASFSNTSRVS